jgi:hypothetical protein
MALLFVVIVPNQAACVRTWVLMLFFPEEDQRRSIEAAPAPRIIRKTVSASASRWNSKPSPYLRSRPVHKQAELMMDHRNSDDHVAEDSKGRNTSEQPEDKTQSTEEFRRNRQKREWGRECASCR